MYNATSDFANAATHNGSPGISQSKKQIFFSCFLHFRDTFLPLCWCVCRHLLPIFPSPKDKLIHLCSPRAGTNAQIQPSRFTPSPSHTHTRTFYLSKQRNGSVFPHRPPSHPYPLAGERCSQTAPISALTYLDIVGEIGP